MKRSSLLFLIVTLFVVECCTPLPKALVPGKSIIQSVSVDATSNALRANVTVSFQENCTWSVTYWETKLGQASAKTTKTVESTSNVVTLLHLTPVTEYQYQINVTGSGSTAVASFETDCVPEDLPVYPIFRTQTDVWRDGYFFQCEDTAPGYLTLCDFGPKIHWYDTYGKGVINFDYNPQTGLIALLLGKKTIDGCPVEYLCEEIRVVDMGGNIVFSTPTTGALEGAHHAIAFTPQGNLVFPCASISTSKVWTDGLKSIDITGKELFSWQQSAGDYTKVTCASADANGDYYASLGSLNQVCKIDGKTGAVVYTYGAEGDVTMDGEKPRGNVAAPYDVFYAEYGIHSLIVYEPDSFSFYANGTPAQMMSRAVFVNVNPNTKIGTYTLVAQQPVPQYSPDLGSVMMVDDQTLLFCGTYPNPIPAYGSLHNLQFLSAEGAMVRNFTRSGISARAQYITDNQIAW